jgi:RNA-binding protein MEX3
MPASLFHEAEHSSSASNGLEDQRALQLALELSMLGLTDSDSLGSNYDADPRNTKKSQNTTECVPVPSSEHVAEIVGRQGCKIKALRAKTNTYIKTPVRGEEPVFVVTGRKEDVCAAKREILSAAEHFSQIRAQRKNNLNGGLTGPGPNSNIPGQTTIQVRVPYRVVGLVVGPKGATIKRIQQQTNTYIITPSRDKEPIFEVTGLPENVETARKEIEAHIAMRTGGVIDSASGGESVSPPNGLDGENGLDGFARNSPESLPFNSGSGAFAGLYNNKSSDTFGAFSNGRDNLLLSPRSQDSFNLTTHNNTNKLADFYSFRNNGFAGAGFGLYDSDEGIGESPTFDSLVNSTSTTASTTASSSMWPEFSAAALRAFSTAISPLERRSSSLGSEGPSSTSSISSVNGHGSSSSPDTELAELKQQQHQPARRLSSDPLTAAFALPASTSPTSAAFATLTGSSSLQSNCNHCGHCGKTD